MSSDQRLKSSTWNYNRQATSHPKRTLPGQNQKFQRFQDSWLLLNKVWLNISQLPILKFQLNGVISMICLLASILISQCRAVGAKITESTEPHNRLTFLSILFCAISVAFDRPIMAKFSFSTL